MIDTFFGFKLGSVQTFDDKGKRLVVSRILTHPAKVVREKTDKKDGYRALIAEFSTKDWKPKNSKSKYVKELYLKKEISDKIPVTVSIDEIFKVGDKVWVSGITKGKGFAGVVKRWGFAGGPKTHGQSDRHRAPGSIGQRSDPGRVWKGKRMSGRMGGSTKTIKGLNIFKIDKENNELWIKGLVPGAKGGLVKIRKN